MAARMLLSSVGLPFESVENSVESHAVEAGESNAEPGEAPVK
jgi:hypothetical protein